MQTSIIIVNWNTKELLRACLKSIELYKSDLDCQVIVVDNSSNDGSADMVRCDFPQVLLLAEKTNLGFGKGNNLGLKRASGEYVLLLNPDTELKPNTLQNVLAFMDKRPDVGLCGVRQLEADGTVQSSCGNFPSLKVMLVQQLMFLAAARGLNQLVNATSRFFNVPLMPVKALIPLFDFSKITEVDWVMGAFMMLRRKAIPSDGLFDERFIMYGEDLDLSARVKSAGHKVVFFGESEILHYGGASTRSISVKAEAMHAVAMVELYRKHHPRQSILYRVFLALGNLGLFFKASLTGNRELQDRSRAKLLAAINPSWRGFLS